MKSFTFVFDGLKGLVDETGFVQWGGMAFQREAAAFGLKQAIDAANPNTACPPRWAGQANNPPVAD